MIIHQPEILQEENTTVLWTKISLDKKVGGFPEYLWFRVSNQYAKFVSTQSDSFLLAAVMAAMYFKENIYVEGVVSPSLAYHLEEHMFVTRLFFPDTLHKVDVQYAQLAPLQAEPTAVGFAFSGGVDSFFTLQKHLPPTQKSFEYQITHAIYINGFDMVRSEKLKYQKLFDQYKGMLQKFNIDLISVETNLTGMLTRWLDYSYLFSPVLIGSAMSLGKLFKRFIVSNSWSYDQWKEKSVISHAFSDRLYSTEKMDIEHFDTTYQRFKKIESLHTWEPVRENLKVCGTFIQDEHVPNCSRCEKCMRTMIPIYILGSMDQFKGFEKPLRSNWDLLRWARKFNPTPGFVKDVFLAAKKHKPQILPWLSIIALFGYMRYWALRLIPGFVKKYLNRFGLFVSRIKEEHAFDDLELNKKLASISESK